jgi:RHH-type transcriptional regulator, proline utilization regulon repressor / proline dehydrogenase / delta 1-pyrroline-5-carboxylate dehydrogenase
MTLTAARDRMAALTLADEAQCVRDLIARAKPGADEARAIEQTARDLVMKIRAKRHEGGLDAFLQEYALTSDEGVALMCLAEALLRVPDAATADRLIKDKIAGADWQSHRGASDSSFVNASTWALMLTGKVLKLEEDSPRRWTGIFRKAVTRSGEPVIRQAMTYAMRIMGGQFVLGRTIGEALDKSREAKTYLYSFDMLGEAALTREDAARYLDSYKAALASIAAKAAPGTLAERPSLSVKLSALHPRYEVLRRAQVMDELLPTIGGLAAEAKAKGIALTIDAEESERLVLSLDLFEALARDSTLSGWNGLGLAVQAYQKRAPAVLDWLRLLAQATGRQLPVRLVKGAYWDTEIKRAQEQGLDGYPVYTRKAATDVSYLACMRQMLAAGPAFFPQFATHNAHSVATGLVLGQENAFEFQRLHGMGAALYDEVVAAKKNARPCRVYAPVGSHEDLLAYLVRRLLENGANTSFVNRLADDAAPIGEIIADPVAALEAQGAGPHPRIPVPPQIYAPRRNARGVLVMEDSVRAGLIAEIGKAQSKPAMVRPILAGKEEASMPLREVRNPAALGEIVGHAADATPEMAARAVEIASRAFVDWDRQGGAARAVILERAADLFERDMALLCGLCMSEAGKTLSNAIGDVREAVDFLRYSAAGARARFGEGEAMPGPTGEANRLRLAGRGVFACIAPWNFPAAIFTGQVAAALAAGNAVVAKPAEQTPVIAAAIVRLFHEAGVPPEALNLVTGDGRIGAALIAHPDVAGVAFTGSTEVARTINRTLAAKDGPIATLIAETGGLNAMIADSTALPEQLVKDAVASAFDSAGQRCSALRLLFVQSDIAPKVIKMLAGAMEELKTGNPRDLTVDVGPVIDAEAKATLYAHIARMTAQARLIARGPAAAGEGHFVVPHAFELTRAGELTRETFGPILHVVRFDGAHLDKVCEAINATGYGLTLGIHTRIAAAADEIAGRVRAGNIYVNRNQIGAVVGVQPFGGEGLSGTGPKAGGPHYLPRFAVERTRTDNTAAAGGNASLLSIDAPE